MVREKQTQRSKVTVRAEETALAMERQSVGLTNNNDENGRNQTEKSNGSGATNSDNDLDQRILGMEKPVGTAFHRNIRRDYGRSASPS